MSARQKEQLEYWQHLHCRIRNTGIVSFCAQKRMFFNLYYEVVRVYQQVAQLSLTNRTTFETRLSELCCQELPSDE